MPTRTRRTIFVADVPPNESPPNTNTTVNNENHAPRRLILRKISLRSRVTEKNDDSAKYHTPPNKRSRIQDDKCITWAPKRPKRTNRTPNRPIVVNPDQILYAPRPRRMPKRLPIKSEITWAPKRPVIRIRRCLDKKSKK